MTLEILFLFAVLAVMVVLFLTEKLPVELTAFMGLATLTLTGYLAADEAFEGFASPAVITMLSIFFISGALLHTGIADGAASRIHAWVGSREISGRTLANNWPRTDLSTLGIASKKSRRLSLCFEAARNASSGPAAATQAA